MQWALRERVLGSLINGEWVPTHRSREPFADAEMLRLRRRIQGYVGKVSPITYDEYCAKYTGLRRATYLNAKKSLESKPLCAEDAYLNTFLKAEKWPEVKAPRVISPRSPRFLLAMGVYIHPLEHRIYRGFRKVLGYPTIMKGLDQEERATVAHDHWHHFTNPIAIGLDASKFDQHTSKKALQFEHGFYLHAHSNCPELAKMCSWQLVNRCFANLDDGKVSWTTSGGRMSGDVNTALGNCLLSATMLATWAKHAGVRIRMMVDGDDCVAFMERGDYAQFMDGLAAWYLRRGYRMKVEGPYTSLHEVEFCQSKFMMLNGTPIFVRNPLKALNQDHTWVQVGGIHHKDVLQATGLGGLAIYGDVPVLGAYYRMLAGDRQLSTKVLKRLDLRSSWLRFSVGASKNYSPPTCDARVEFYRTFGIHAADQVDLERIYLRTQVPSTSLYDPNQIINAQLVNANYTPSFLATYQKH
jgi:hypothetical protein